MRLARFSVDKGHPTLSLSLSTMAVSLLHEKDYASPCEEGEVLSRPLKFFSPPFMATFDLTLRTGEFFKPFVTFQMKSVVGYLQTQSVVQVDE